MRLAFATVAALLALAAPAWAASDFRRYGLFFDAQLAAAEGPFFLQAQDDGNFSERSFRINLVTGSGRRIRMPGLDMRAGGDRVAFQRAIQDEVGPEFLDTAVVAQPARGGPTEALDSAHSTSGSYGQPGFCGSWVQLVDVTTDGEVVVNRSRKPCDQNREGRGTLYIYGPEGRRRLTRRHVSGAFRGDRVFRVARDRVLLEDDRAVYLIDTRTGSERRLLRDAVVITADLDRHGRAVLLYRDRHGVDRVRLFLAGGTSRVIATPSGQAGVRFCGEGLAIFQFGGRLQSLTFRDHPTARPRTLRFEEPGYATGRYACNSRTFGFVEDRESDDGYTSLLTVQAFSLHPRQPGEPRSAAP
jgi:hypothetical protein